MNKRKWTKAEIEEYRRAHGAFLYFNKEDSNFLIPKAYGIGWSLNWANPFSWMLVLVIILLIAIRKL